MHLDFANIDASAQESIPRDDSVHGEENLCGKESIDRKESVCENKSVGWKENKYKNNSMGRRDSIDGNNNVFEKEGVYEKESMDRKERVDRKKNVCGKEGQGGKENVCEKESVYKGENVHPTIASQNKVLPSRQISPVAPPPLSVAISPHPSLLAKSPLSLLPSRSIMASTANSSFHCSPCGRDFPNKGSLVRHNNGQKHADIVAGVPAKVKLPRGRKRKIENVDKDDGNASNVPRPFGGFGNVDGDNITPPNVSDKMYGYGVNIPPNSTATPMYDPNSAYAQEQREFWDAVIQPGYVPPPVTEADFENVDFDTYIQLAADSKALIESMGEIPVEENVLETIGDWETGFGGGRVSEKKKRGRRWST
ncbi:uncharacterized protein PAC_11906 [Phialocephala subalpina]|uniref:C2H2-type domain-containing protein n=1 Tax=Phialocephala subalpina TaxID=576137 RepID=A0A1L7XAG1_9HELO|nr:uncharacterized protein PAC_11906 [Phialocephala subalpina]